MSNAPTHETLSERAAREDHEQALREDAAAARIYHGHPRFYELLEELRDLHDRKNHDYSGAANPLGNLRMCEAQGIPAWKGVVLRLGDKFSRLQQFAKSGEFKVSDESVIDTLRDNAVYSLLAIILYEEQQTAKGRTP